LTVLDNGPDGGRIRYPIQQRVAIYHHLLDTIRRNRPDQICSLCMEDFAVAEALDLTRNIGRCNCIL
jgi:hypothetical protein